jgi:hypothetical protein
VSSLLLLLLLSARCMLCTYPLLHHCLTDNRMLIQPKARIGVQDVYVLTVKHSNHAAFVHILIFLVPLAPQLLLLLLPLALLSLLCLLSSDPLLHTTFSMIGDGYRCF